MCENILLQSLEYYDLQIYPFPHKFDLLSNFFLLIGKNGIFSCYNDADTDAYACSNKVRMYLWMWILVQMQIKMRTGLFPTRSQWGFVSLLFSNIAWKYSEFALKLGLAMP